MRLIVVRIAPVTPVTDEQKRELTSIAQSRSLPAGYVFRAKLILMLSEGATFAIIRERMDGLDTNHPGQKPYRLATALRAKILNATRSKPADGSTHWSCRKLAKALGVSKDVVHRVPRV